MRHVTRCLTVTLAGCLCSSSLLANPEPPVLTDGRSNAMGHTGVATDDYATGTYHNPAALGAVKTVGVTASVTPVYAKLKAPFPNATGGFDSKDSEPIIAPLGTLGFGYRVHERVVVGLGAFVTSATGARYTGVVAGRDVDAAAFAAEFHLPVAVNVTDDFSVGAAYRVTFARLGITAPALVPGVGLVDTDTTMSGFNFAGFSLGARYRISDAVRLGLTYRSKVVVDLEGETEFSNTPAPIPASESKGEFPLPHTFKLGTEFSLMEKKLVLAVDGAYWLYSDSHGEDPENMRGAAWDDSIGANLGAEYWASEQVPVRAGFIIYKSATTPESAIPFGIPPGMAYVITAGSGIKLETVDLDLGLAYQILAGETVSAAENPAGAGEYSGHAFIGTVSANFRP